MLKVNSKFIATVSTVIALIGFASIASADQGVRVEKHQLKRLEMKLHRLEAKEKFDVNTGRTRAAVKTEKAIERTRREIRDIRRG